MNTAHVDDYFAPSGKGTACASYLAENIVLLGPIFPEPTVGKDAVVEVLSGFLETKLGFPAMRLVFASDA